MEDKEVLEIREQIETLAKIIAELETTAMRLYLLRDALGDMQRKLVEKLPEDDKMRYGGEEQ